MNDAASTYEVQYFPPKYPDRCFPGRCRHEPQFVMHADLRVERVNGRNTIEIDHAVCLACGATQPCTIGGNVLVDLTMVADALGPKHWKFAVRAQALRNKWAKLATYLFDENGWTGRHERVARKIDPNLTMRLALGPNGSSGVRVGQISFDPCYVRGSEGVAP